ncbi:MAG: hypothetical protein JW860_13335 [Sedimentisphaerales bacterium]|nr:hypothetical protein [Sedimentisphaerales bacterium]
MQTPIKTTLILALLTSWAQALTGFPGAGSDNLIEMSSSSLSAETGGVSTSYNGEFDTSRYIDIDQIMPGMRGYGLTVFKGTKIERFDVVAVSVISNAGPKRSAILILCEDERFDKARGVQGVSGSPVYFNDKLAGAMAFGWAFGEDPLYGVTPIREMLELRYAGDMTGRDYSGRSMGWERSVYQNLMADELLGPDHIEWLVRQAGLAKDNAGDTALGQTGLTALPLTVSVSGLSAPARRILQERIPTLNLTEGVSSNGIIDHYAGQTELAPGASLTIPLVTGDMSSEILGTATEVVGDRVYGFGHSWNGYGAAAWPMGTGYVHTFVSRTNMSFKLGQIIDVVGTIRADEAAGVYGRVGQTIDMVPIQVELEWPELGLKQDFNVQMAREVHINPILSAAVVLNALIYRGELPQEHHIQYRIEMGFDKVEPIIYENISSGSKAGDILQEILNSIGLLLLNPWEEVQLSYVKAKASIHEGTKTGIIRSAQLPALEYHPGQRVTASVLLEPDLEPLQEVKISLELPQDLPEGDYKIMVGSYQNYQRQLQNASPHRYSAYDINDVQRMLQERLSIRKAGLYMSMALPGTGLAIENQELPDLPASKTMMLSDKSRQIMLTSFNPLLSTYLPNDYILFGQKTFNIEVKRK